MIAPEESLGTTTTVWSDGRVDRPAYVDPYIELCKEETGLPVPQEVVDVARKRKEVLWAQTFTMADALEREGVKAYRDNQYFLWRMFVHSELVETLPASTLGRIMILPAVAAAVRAPMLSAAEYFCQCNPFCRFWTFTSGERVTAAGLRKRIRYLHRKLSALNAQPFMTDLGVEIVFRSTETGTPEFNADGKRVAQRKWSRVERGPRGEYYYHPHAHCIVHLKNGPIHPVKWACLFKQIWAFWGHQWDGGKRGESGVIRNVRECVKYVTKPAEMVKLPDAELAAVARALSRVKLAHPMGSLAADIARRKNAVPKLRLVRVPAANGEGRILREIKDWNAKGPVPPANPDKKPGEPKKDVFRVVSTCLPTCGAAGLKEPSVIIMTSFARLSSALARTHPVVIHIANATRHEWAAGAAIRVHTCTPTVLKKPPERPERPRGKPRTARIGAERAGF